MTETNFSEILSGSVLGEIERPKPLPAGSYQATIKNVEFLEAKNDKKTPYARVNLNIVGAMEDVDADLLAEFGDVNGKTTRVDFYLTPESRYRFQDFILTHVGLELEGQTLDQAVPHLTNQVVGVKIKHEISRQDSETVYAVSDGTFNCS